MSSANSTARFSRCVLVQSGAVHRHVGGLSPPQSTAPPSPAAPVALAAGAADSHFSPHNARRAQRRRRGRRGLSFTPAGATAPPTTAALLFLMRRGLSHAAPHPRLGAAQTSPSTPPAAPRRHLPHSARRPIRSGSSVFGASFVAGARRRARRGCRRRHAGRGRPPTPSSGASRMKMSP